MNFLLGSSGNAADRAEAEMIRTWLRTIAAHPTLVCDHCRTPISYGCLCSRCSTFETTERELIEKREVL